MLDDVAARCGRPGGHPRQHREPGRGEPAKGESPQEEPTSGPGNSDAAKACQQGGYANLVGADGTQFANAGECVSYAARGGTLLVDPGCRAAAAALGLNPDGYTIILGTEGSDVFDARVTGGPGFDLRLWRGRRNHQPRPRRRLPGRIWDAISPPTLAEGSSFYGEAGRDYVLGELQGGMVFGGADADVVDQIAAGTFNGEAGDDDVGSMEERRHLQRRGRQRRQWAICFSSASSTEGPATTREES